MALLRDGDTGPELLMVRRNKALAFAGGFWVFPGGALDDEDIARGKGDDDAAARFAASREAEEEAGLSPDPESMVLVSHWTTPVAEKKRFSTWIYAGSIAADAEVQIDGSEIHDYQWISPAEALAANQAGELPMMPPTYFTLCALARYASAAEALAGERETPCPRVLPLLIPGKAKGDFTTLYPGDVAYDSGEVGQPGPRHRAFLDRGGWQYLYDDACGVPPLYPQD